MAFEVGKVLGRAAQKLQQHRDNFSNLAGQNSFLRVMVPLNRIWTCLLTKRDPQNELVNDFSFVTFTPLIEGTTRVKARVVRDSFHPLRHACTSIQLHM